MPSSFASPGSSPPGAARSPAPGTPAPGVEASAEPQRATREALDAGFWVGAWRVEPTQNRLLRVPPPDVAPGDGEAARPAGDAPAVVQIEPKVMEVLCLLATQPAQTVTKAQFKEAIWRDMVVTDDVLARCISEVRKALGDDARNPTYIETIRKTGYRLIAPTRYDALRSSAPHASAPRRAAHRAPSARIEASRGDAARGDAVPYASARAAEGSHDGAPIRRPSASAAARTGSGAPRRVLSARAELQATLAALGASGADGHPERAPSVAVLPIPSADADRRQLRIVAGGVLLLVAVLVSGLFWPSGDAAAPPESATPPRTLPLTTYPGQEIDPAISPDGERVVFAWDGGEDGGPFNLYLRQMGAESPLRITETEADDVSPVWSPGGRFVAFARYDGEQYTVHVVASIGGTERQVARFGAREIQGLTWSPDPAQRRLVVAARQGAHGPSALYTVELATGATAPLTTPPPYSEGDLDPAFAPDGRRVAFTRSIAASTEDVYLVDLATRAVEQVTTDSTRITGLDWAADGDALLVASSRGGASGLWRVPLAADAEPTWVTAASEGSEIRHPSVAPDADRLAYVQHAQSTNIWTLGWRGTRLVPTEALVASTQRDAHPAIGPREERIAFVSRRSGHPEVWSVRADGSAPAHLTTLEGPSVATPRWHPDSALVAFAARHSSHTDVYLVRADGGPARAVASTPHEERMPAWSRDGRRLYFASNRSGSWQIWQVDVRRPEAAPRRMTRDGGLAAQEGADGRALYVVRPDTTGIWRLPLAPGATTTGATTTGAAPAAAPGARARTPRAAAAEQVVPDFAPLDYANWHLAPDGLYYVRRQGRRADLVFHRFATGRRRVVARLGDLPRDAALALAPSGRWGLVARLDRQASDILLVENVR